MRVLRRASRYFRDDAAAAWAWCVCVAAAALAGVAVPVPLAIFFNLLDPNQAGGDGYVYRLFAWLPRERNATTIFALAGVTLALRLLGELLRAGQTALNIRVGYRGRSRVQLDLFSKLQRQSLAWHRGRPRGDLLHRLGHDTAGFHALLNVLAAAVVNAASLAIMLVVMFDLNVPLTLVALAVVPPLWGTMALWQKRLRDGNLGQRDAEAAVTTQGQRALIALPLAQSFGRERWESGRFAARVGDFTAASLRLHRQEILYNLALGTVVALGAAAMLGYGGLLVLHGTLGVGSLWLFLSYLASLYDPLNRLAGSAAGAQSAAAGVRRVLEVLDETPDVVERPHPVRLPVAPRAVVFERVSFRYLPDAAPALDGVSFRVEPGECVAIVGASGAGKTTLLNLLPRFADPTAGRVCFGEVDLRSASLGDVRRHVALVSQDNMILPASVRENLVYGRPDATPGEVRRAAELAGAAEFIERLPAGYDTVLGEAGADLSGGQRQRLAIARALLTQAPVLVLDEPTSALDAAAEARLIETLDGLRGGRTVLLVTHRPAVAAVADRVLTLRNGRLIGA